MGCPICGSRIFGTIREKHTNSINFSPEALETQGAAIQYKALTPVGSQPKHIQAQGKQNIKTEGKKAQSESREDVEKVKLLRWGAFNRR